MIVLRRRLLWNCYEVFEKLAVLSKTLLNIVAKSLFTLPTVERQQFIGEVGTFINSGVKFSQGVLYTKKILKLVAFTELFKQ